MKLAKSRDEYRITLWIFVVFSKHELQFLPQPPRHPIIFIPGFGTGAEINLVTTTQNRDAMRGENTPSPTPKSANRA
jgi:hypothetical protein